MRLEVVGVGPQKAGTTWLYRSLQEHPRLCFPQTVKETFFLDRRFEKGWPWYWSHFQHCSGDQLCAEIGPSYFDIPETVTRLQEHNSHARIIITLRDPAERSFSLYLHHTRRGRLNCTFQDAMTKMPRIIDSSRYRKHIGRWIEAFGREQVLIILLQDISSHPEQVLEQVYDFLEISHMPLPAVAKERVYTASLPRFPVLAKLATQASEWLRDKRLYAPLQFAKNIGLKFVYTGGSDSLPKLAPETREALIQEFEPDIAYVESLLDRSLTEWRH